MYACLVQRSNMGRIRASHTPDCRYRKFRVLATKSHGLLTITDPRSSVDPPGRTSASPVDPPEAYWFALVAGQFCPPDPLAPPNQT